MSRCLVEVHGSDGYRVEGVARPSAWLTDPEPLRGWVARLDGRIVGHIALSEPGPGDAAATILLNATGDDRPVVIGRLFVSPAARGHAIGAQLLQAATNYAATLDRRPVLDVIAKDTAAIRLYERAGWHRTGTTEHPTGQGDTVTATATSDRPGRAHCVETFHSVSRRRLRRQIDVPTDTHATRALREHRPDLSYEAIPT